MPGHLRDAADEAAQLCRDLGQLLYDWRREGFLEFQTGDGKPLLRLKLPTLHSLPSPLHPSQP